MNAAANKTIVLTVSYYTSQSLYLGHQRHSDTCRKMISPSSCSLTVEESMRKIVSLSSARN
jgi:hypothetical protein